MTDVSEAREGQIYRSKVRSGGIRTIIRTSQDIDASRRQTKILLHTQWHGRNQFTTVLRAVQESCLPADEIGVYNREERQLALQNN